MDERNSNLNIVDRQHHEAAVVRNPTTAVIRYHGAAIGVINKLMMAGVRHHIGAHGAPRLRVTSATGKAVIVASIIRWLDAAVNQGAGAAHEAAHGRRTPPCHSVRDCQAAQERPIGFPRSSLCPASRISTWCCISDYYYRRHFQGSAAYGSRDKPRGHICVRATHGHSLKGVNPDMQDSSTEYMPSVLVHATQSVNHASILKYRLCPGGDQPFKQRICVSMVDPQDEDAQLMKLWNAGGVWIHVDVPIAKKLGVKFCVPGSSHGDCSHEFVPATAFERWAEFGPGKYADKKKWVHQQLPEPIQVSTSSRPEEWADMKKWVHQQLPEPVQVSIPHLPPAP